MANFTRIGRAFYGIGIAGIGVQQFIYGNFRPVLLPLWPARIPGLLIWAYLAGTALIVAGAIILFSKKPRFTALILGGVFLLLFLTTHVIFQSFFSPYDFHLGLWTDALKELALSGGALVVAGSYPEDKSYTDKYLLTRFLGKLIPLGRIFFSVTMILFGIDHFIYTEFVATLVPGWIPGHVFWTYFAAVALIGAGVAIILNIKVRLIGILLGTMMFLWFVFLHIPRAFADPHTGEGNEITSVFEALAFSGIAFVIAFSSGLESKRIERAV